jgi:hypothetical protein
MNITPPLPERPPLPRPTFDWDRDWADRTARRAAWREFTELSARRLVMVAGGFCPDCGRRIVVSGFPRLSCFCGGVGEIVRTECGDEVRWLGPVPA